MIEIPERPRLLVLASTYPRWAGDPEPGFVHELARRLVSRFNVTVLCPHAAGAMREELLDGVRVLRYRYAPNRLETLVNDGGIIANLRRAPWKWALLPLFLLAMAWRTWRHVAHEPPDVIHAHWLIPQGLIVACLGLVDRRIPPFVVTSHGADLFALRSRPLQALKRFVVRKSAAVTVVSSVMKDEMARLGIDVGKVDVEPMGVDLRCRFTPDVQVIRSRDEILFVGRLVEKKGLQHLINALPLIAAERASVFLTVVGFGPEESERRAQVERMNLSGRVQFLGPVSQAGLPKLYRRAAVFVAPFVQAESGDQEGLGLVLAEAAGCGCPIVAGRVPAVLDVLEGGLDASIVDATNPAELAKSILTHIGAKSSMSGSISRAQTVARFGWDTCAESYARLLENSMKPLM